MKSRTMRWARRLARTKEIDNAYKILVGKPKHRRLLGRRRRTQNDNIRIDIKEDVDWICFAWNECQWGALEETIMNSRVL
jgi:hypothetical protein